MYKRSDIHMEDTHMRRHVHEGGYTHTEDIVTHT